MDAAFLKWETLQQAYEGSDELDRVFDKLLAGKLSEQRLLLARYDRDLADFERRFNLDSPTFYARFEAGELGDEMDYFEWAGLWELRQHLKQKIQRLEQVSP
jgi:hypothetical protein